MLGWSYSPSQLAPPELKETPEAPKEAEARLKAMGPMSLDEKIMLGTMGLALFFWVSERMHGPR